MQASALPMPQVAKMGSIEYMGMVAMKADGQFRRASLSSDFGSPSPTVNAPTIGAGLAKGRSTTLE